MRSKRRRRAPEEGCATPKSTLRSARASQIAGILSAGIGGISLIEGNPSFNGLKALIPGYRATSPEVSVALILSGLAVWRSGKQPVYNVVVSRLCAASVVIIGALTLWFERISPVIPAVFVLVGFSLLLVIRTRAIVSQLMAFTAGVISLLELQHYLMGAGPFVGMPVQTSFALVIICTGALFLTADSGLMGTVTKRTPGGYMARRLLPVALFTPMGLALIKVTGDSHGYDLGLLLAFLIIAVLAYVVWAGANGLNRADAERSLANMKMQASEKRYETLVESLPLFIWTCLPDGTCDYLSPQWVNYTGIPAAGQLNFRWIEQIHPDDRDEVAEKWSAAVRLGELFLSEIRVRRHDGAYRWFQARAIPFRDAENQIIKWFGSSTDIQETRETRLALEREQERLASLVALAPAVFCTLALTSRGVLTLPYASPRLADLLGIHPNDVAESASFLFTLIHHDDYEWLYKSIMASAETASQWDREFRVNHPYKGERWIEGHGTPVRDPEGGIVWHGFLTDITDRKHAERELAEYARTIDLSHDAIVVMGPDRSITEWNTGAAEMYGWTRREAKGQMLHKLLQTKDDVSTRQILEALARNGRWDGELTHTTKSGEVCIVESREVLVSDRSGKATSILKIDRDVTKRKYLERALYKANRRLDQRVNELRLAVEEKGVLIREVQHRVKNNLAVISSMLTLEAGRHENSEVVGALQESRDRIQSMALIHEKFCHSDNLAQIDFGEYVESLAANVLNSYAVDVDAIRLSMDVSVKLLMEEAIPCGLIIQELLSNSLKHAFPEGTGEIRIDFHTSCGELKLCYQDSGVGLGSDVDLKKPRSLGLQLVTDLVAQLEGRFEYQYLSGASFSLSFPSRHSLTTNNH